MIVVILTILYSIFIFYFIGVCYAMLYILFWEMEYEKNFPKIDYNLMWRSWFFKNPHISKKSKKKLKTYK
jgi:hypothetical protein